MTITTSISDFRNNVSSYLKKAASGTHVIVKDEKRGEEIARITGARSFKKDDYEKVLKKSAGTLSGSHSEWKNRSSIKKWLTHSRQESERNFE